MAMCKSCTAAEEADWSALLQGRCAAVVLYASQVALLPSRGADSLEAVVDAGGLSQPSTLGNSYTVNLAKLGIKEARLLFFRLHRRTPQTGQEVRSPGASCCAGAGRRLPAQVQ